MARANPYLTHPRLADFYGWMGEGRSLVLEELWEAPKALLLALAQEATQKHLVILTNSKYLFDDLFYFTDKKPLEFPAWEALPSEAIPPSPDVVGERYRVLRELRMSRTPQLVVTSWHALLQKMLPPEKLDKLHLVLKVGESLPFELLPEYLAEMGYHRRTVAADKGEFAVRGGILDIFPVSSPDPIRMEFWEDRLVSLRKYDPISQTSVEKIETIVITPGEERELLVEAQELSTFLEHLGPSTLLVMDNLHELEDKYVALQKEGGQGSRYFMTLEAFLKQQATLQTLYFSDTSLEAISPITYHKKEPSEHPLKNVSFELLNHPFSAERWQPPFLPLEEEPLARASEYTSIRFLYQKESEKRALLEKAEGLTQATFETGYLSSGFLLHAPDDSVTALIPMSAFTHRYQLRRQKQRTHYHTVPTEALSLNPGESVVHMNNGIGRYLGMEKRPNHLGVETEFLIIEYAQGGKLYVPMENANLLSKYIGATDVPPELHTLGSSRWQRCRERTQQAIVGYARDLLKLQAERVMKGRTPYPSDSALTQQFYEEFPYEETPDQQLAIDSIRADMERSQSMDRLICGDVGYGKTEVAMRAAFKTVVDGGEQVALLVPTTMLALQHYETFSERMSNFPVTLGLLSRFAKPKALQETLEGVRTGRVDIVIGTHRMISQDVTFHKLGLIIIDEEQRFGVKAKEYLKQIRSEVNCLTLSATPIPRTLYMSLVGARDLSLINTPPEDRLPIHSLICTASDELIKNALLRELSREGQAFVVHNRVETIYGFAEKIQALVPNARLVVGHGQMSAQALDTVFHTFKSGQADILVATSIIENGIDIPRANTILIDRADRFGLADLYQMRGRVGRWNRKAYCYFMVPNTQEMSELSRQRLSALTRGGNGMKLAMHDLELRGAGNILGTEQSGHVSSIGFHLYCKLLKKTVAALAKNEMPLLDHEVKLELPFDARLPEAYIHEAALRMDLYQRLGDAASEQEVDQILEEVRDRFGPPPPQVEWLRLLTQLRLFALHNQFTLIKLVGRILLAEQQHGKKQKQSKKLVLTLPSTPEAVKACLIQELSKNFPIRPKEKP